MSTDSSPGGCDSPRSQYVLEGIELSRCERVTTDQADAETRLVLSIHVCAHPIIGTTGLDASVTPDDSVITDAVPIEAEMHGVDLTGTDVDVVIGRRTVHDQMPDGRRLEHTRTVLAKRQHGRRRVGLPCCGV